MGLKAIDQYKHLNDRDKFRAEVDLEDVATQVISMNYGVHRLLSAIVRQRLAAGRKDKLEMKDELALGILALLEQGLF